MVVAVRCPNPNCRKFMLVEAEQQGQVIPCLICKKPIKVPQSKGSPEPAEKPKPIHSTPYIEEQEEILTPIFDDDEPQFKMD